MPWPILIKNLRHSCANDWRTATEAPAPAIAAWTGHGVTVQDSAYATVGGGYLEEFNAKKHSEKWQHRWQQTPRIDADDDESELSWKLSPTEKRSCLMKSLGFRNRTVTLQRTHVSRRHH